MNFRIIEPDPANSNGPDRPVLLFRQDDEVVTECYSDSGVSHCDLTQCQSEEASQSFIRDFSPESATEFINRMKKEYGDD